MRRRLPAKTPSAPQIRQLSVKRLKFHLSRKPCSRRAPKGRSHSFGYFSPNRIGGWPPLIDPRVSTSIRLHNSASRLRAALCGETSSATSETFSAPNFRRWHGGACARWYTEGGTPVANSNGDLVEINVAEWSQRRMNIPRFRMFELRRNRIFHPCK